MGKKHASQSTYRYVDFSKFNPYAQKGTSPIFSCAMDSANILHVEVADKTGKTPNPSSVAQVVRTLKRRAAYFRQELTAMHRFIVHAQHASGLQASGGSRKAKK